MKRIILAVSSLALWGCTSAHNPFIIRNTTSGVPGSTKVYSAHTNAVWVTSEGLPPSVPYELVEQVEVGKTWYGSKADINQSMAERARQIGADAVVELKTWRQPSGFSWSAPHGSGKAIKVSDGAKTNLTVLKGSWY